MKIEVSIFAEERDSQQQLQMSEQFSDYDGYDSLGIVYQDDIYSFEVFVEDAEIPIDEIRLFINNEQYNIDFVQEEDKFISIKNINSMRPFLLYFGLVHISVRVSFIDDSEKIFYSSYLAVGIKEDYIKTEKSVNDMLDFVYKKEHALLYHGKPHNETILPQYLRNTDNKYTQEIELLKAIALTMEKEQPYFHNNANQKIITNYAIDRFDKLSSIRSENIRFLTMHPEELQRSYYSNAILVNGIGYEPVRTLIEKKENSCDTYENQCILSFIFMLSTCIDNRIENIKRILEDSKHNLKTNQPVRENYILSYQIIQRYIRTTFEDLFEAFVELKKRIRELLSGYYKILLCHYTSLQKLPRPTSVFMELHHYRAIYEMMNLWFGYSLQTKPTNYVHYHFNSADSIYEFYCLINLYDLIVNLGFSLMEEESFSYDPPDKRYVQPNEKNTYRFTKGRKELTLYYHPVIYSKLSRTTNDINLFRTDGSFYVPDFVIKLVEYDDEENVKNNIYGIIDAKWRNRNTLTTKDISGGLYDLINRYYFSIRTSDTCRTVDFLWLLQGKDDLVRNNAFFYHKGNISKSHSRIFRYSTGIFQLTPEYGNKDLMEALNVYFGA